MAPDKKTHLSLAFNNKKSYGNEYKLATGVSPVTDLSNQMDDLFSSSRPFATPKRRFSWGVACDDTPPNAAIGGSTEESGVVGNRCLMDISNECKEPEAKVRKFPSIQILFDSESPNPPKESDAELLRDLECDVVDSPFAQIRKSSLPTGFHGLIKDPIAETDGEADEAVGKENFLLDSCDGRKCIRGLFGQPSRGNEAEIIRGKRAEAYSGETPVPSLKRRKAFSYCSQNGQRPQLQRCYSETEASNIMKAVQLSADNPDLIGDFSRSYALPLVKSKHEDLKSISPETMYRLLRGEYKSAVGTHVVIDCRYPYEYAGGHIQGAINIYSKDAIASDLLEDTSRKNLSERLVLIFHCEFSSERGPSLSRFLRNKDRALNEYPSLHYPEMYILNGGYKAFFERFKQFCEPQAYKPMLHKDHEDDLRFYRAKSKASNEERKKKISRCGLKL